METEQSVISSATGELKISGSSSRTFYFRVSHYFDLFQVRASLSPCLYAFVLCLNASLLLESNVFLCLSFLSTAWYFFHI
jgi:hypothetical protein